jgi:hypothetical protein
LSNQNTIVINNISILFPQQCKCPITVSIASLHQYKSIAIKFSKQNAGKKLQTKRNGHFLKEGVAF